MITYFGKKRCKRDWHKFDTKEMQKVQIAIQPRKKGQFDLLNQVSFKRRENKFCFYVD